MSGQLPLRQLPEKAKQPNTVVLRINGKEIVLDLETLSDEHAAWIERKRLERGEAPAPDEVLHQMDNASCRECGGSFRKEKGSRRQLCRSCYRANLLLNAVEGGRPKVKA